MPTGRIVAFRIYRREQIVVEGKFFFVREVVAATLVRDGAMPGQPPRHPFRQLWT